MTMQPLTPQAFLDTLSALHPLAIESSHIRLRELIAALAMRTDIEPSHHLGLLEAARPHVAYFQGEMAALYASQPLSPQAREETILQEVSTLWRNMANQYGDLAEKASDHPFLEVRQALLYQRQIHCLGQEMAEYFRAHRAMPEGLWKRLHLVYAKADKKDVVSVRVHDDLNETWKAQSGAEAYIAILLIDIANPYGRTPLEFDWTCRWAQRFAAYCQIQPEKPGLKSTHYGVDWQKDTGLRPCGQLANTGVLRYFDGSRLAGQIEAVLTQLKQGISPQALGLGEEAPAKEVGRLLLMLYRPWGMASAGRKFPRRAAAGKARLFLTWPKLYQQLITPKPLPPVPNEAWAIIDQSLGGFRLRKKGGREYLEHNQMVGVQVPESEYTLLARISWLMYRADGELELGLQLLPGIPKAIEISIPQTQTRQGKVSGRAFLLPEMPSLQVDMASIIIPSGWYAPQRLLQIEDQKGGIERIRTLRRLYRGSNFEQVSFESA
jgi:cyclic-di-GMP-binding protein